MANNIEGGVGEAAMRTDTQVVGIPYEEYVRAVNPPGAELLRVPDMEIRTGRNWVTEFDWKSSEARLLDPNLHHSEDDRRLSEDLATLRFAKIFDNRKPTQPIVLSRQFGRMVKVLRRECNLSRLELARRANIDPSGMSLLEMGQLKPEELSTDVVDRITGALTLRREDLVVDPFNPR